MRIDDFADRFVTRFWVDYNAGKRDVVGTARQIATAIKRNMNISEVSDLIGMGSFGMAARIAVSEWMLKLTTDESEVRSSAAIKQLDLPNVARIFDAAFIGGLLPGTVVGVVINERMDTIGTGDPTSDRLLDGIVEGLRSQHDLDLVEMPEAHRRQVLESASESLVERLRAMRDYRLNEIANGVEQLRSHGVFVLDTHSGNVGFTGRGPIKLFDLGLSSSPKKRVPHIAEPSR